MKNSSGNCSKNESDRQAAGALQVGKPLETGDLYIQREADCVLPEALLRGDFCYVLAPHRVGKSSLSHRTQRRLTEAGAGACISINLSGFGEQTTREEFYHHFVHKTCTQLGVPIDPNDFWTKEAPASPAHRWCRLLRALVSSGVAPRLFIFVDEMNVALRLPFSVDEFFGVIHELYDEGPDDSTSRRISFCVLGAVAQRDLLPDPAHTPADVGLQISVDDFTRQELNGFGAVVASFADSPSELLDVVHKWTHGHPFMTQRILSELQGGQRVEHGSERHRTEAAIRKFFLGPQPDDMVGKVYEYFERANPVWGVPRTAQMLELYDRLLAGEEVPTERRNPVQISLRLTGVASDRDVGDRRSLCVRNPIFAEIFNPDWVRKELADRFVAGPLDEWRMSNVSQPAQRRADRLLRGESLSEATAWSECRNDLTPDEQDFIIRSQEADRKRLRKRWLVTYIITFLFVCAVATSWSLLREVKLTLKITQALRALNVAYEQLERAPEERYMVSTSKGWSSAALDATWRLILLAEQEGIEIGPADRLLMSIYAHRVPHLVGVMDHDEPVWGAAFLPESSNTSFMTADQLGRVFFWNSPHDREPVSVVGHGGGVTGIIMSPDKQRAVTISRDKTARLWDTLNRVLIGEPLKHGGMLTHAAFSGDARRLVTCGYDGFAKVWELSDTRQPLANLEHADWVMDAALNTDGSRVVTSSLAPTQNGKHIALLWTLSSGQIGKPQPLRHDKGVTAVRFVPNGQRVLCASNDRKVLIWDISESSGPRVEQELLHPSAVRFVMTSPRSDAILTVCDDDTVRIWNAKSGSQIRKTISVESRIRRARFSPNGSQIVVAAADDMVRVYDVHGSTDAVMMHHPASVWDARLGGDSDQLVLTACADGTARLWELPRAQRYVLKAPYIRSGTFDRRGARIATRTRKGTVHIWTHRLETDTWEAESISLQDTPRVETIAFAGPDSAALVGLRSDGAVGIWDASSGRLLFDPFEPEGAVIATVLAPDGSKLLTATERGVDLWNVQTRERIALQSPTHESRRSLAFSEDGALFAVSQANGAVCLYDASSATRIGEPQAETGSEIEYLRFGQRGCVDVLVAACGDCRVRVWEVTTASLKALRTTSRAKTSFVGIGRPEGGVIVTGSQGGTVVAWDLRTGRRIADLEKAGDLHSVSLSPDGRWMLLVEESEAFVIRLPQPQRGTAEQLRVWAECRTGVTMRELNKPRALTARQWHALACEGRPGDAP